MLELAVFQLFEKIVQVELDPYLHNLAVLKSEDLAVTTNVELALYIGMSAISSNILCTAEPSYLFASCLDRFLATSSLFPPN